MQNMALIQVEGLWYGYIPWQECPPPELPNATSLWCHRCQLRTWVASFTPPQVVSAILVTHEAPHVVEDAEAIIRQSSEP